MLPAFTGAPEQLWRIDQLADGTYRLMPKAMPDSNEPLALSAVGSSTPTLARFDPTATGSDGCSRRHDRRPHQTPSPASSARQPVLDRSSAACMRRTLARGAAARRIASALLAPTTPPKRPTPTDSFSAG